MDSSQNRYNQRGVSSSKEEVHKIVDHMDRGLFPGAFCKITTDLLTGNQDLCNLIHSDGAGTKSILGYLWYRETGDPCEKFSEMICLNTFVYNCEDRDRITSYSRL